ncbi:hypothetical protein CPB84DRAFT_1854588 [Gymnopilus junonius]|uniref:Uncharacterized protein n=1 Tax=Gymnopilus junonius TaxID=109634 RepID=A0A9P5N9G7_GYMJU|nr:hypothetical protein CPB84DRAFT_1854588 [Gymnopilus junonius]
MVSYRLTPNSSLALPRGVDAYGGRPGSMLSLVSHGSVMTKSGIIKDERDTPMRRTRHRDGKLLRGGLGLTTGLGWSDSEDEDAPSPLTRRLSTLNLSRRSSASSIMTGASSSRPTTGLGQRHPLSRSFSSGALVEQSSTSVLRRSYPRHEFDEFDDDDFLEEEEGEVDNTLMETGEWAQRHSQAQHRERTRIPSGGSSILSKPPSKATLPPTSWHRTAATATTATTTSTTTTTRTPSGISRSSYGTTASRTSTSSVGSSFSLEVTAAGDPVLVEDPNPSGGARGLGLRRDSTSSSAGGIGMGRPSAMKKMNSRDDFSVTTPSESTASTLSIPMPATPKDSDADGDGDEESLTLASSTTPVPGSKIRSMYNKDKSLPPLPSRSMPSFSRLDGTTATTTTTSTATAATRIAFPAQGLRPLQLPRHAAAVARTGGDRPAVPVPSVLSSSSPRGSLRTPSLGSAGHSFSLSPMSPDSVPSSPLPPPSSPDASGIAKPKPRTGTGMVYRSSNSTSKMRPPMALSSSTSATAAAAALSASSSSAVRSIGRPGGTGKPIAL